VTSIPTVAQEVFDVSGAGDTVISTFTLALASGASKREAAYISNFAAGIVVGKVGTAVTTRKELVQAIERGM
jgi:D-glycero-beta-D-manno-heptose-7-phosphate kinase